MAARAALLAIDATYAEVNVGIGPAREPVWPLGIIGSISHARGFAAAVAVRRPVYTGVGIYVEDVVAADSHAALRAIALNECEFDYVRRMTGSLTLDTLLTIAFSAKESLFKAAYPSVGRYFDFSAAQLLKIDIDAGTLAITLTESLSADFERGRICCAGFELLASDVVLTHCVV